MDRSLHCLFCDDVRQELGNKISLMGIYFGQMQVGEFPFEIPSLFVSMKAIAMAGDEFQSLCFQVLLNNDVVAEVNIPPQQLTPHPTLPPTIDGVDALQVHIFQTFVQLPSLRLTAPAALRTRVVTERETIRGDGLLIVPVQR